MLEREREDVGRSVDRRGWLGGRGEGERERRRLGVGALGPAEPEVGAWEYEWEWEWERDWAGCPSPLRLFLPREKEGGWDLRAWTGETELAEGSSPLPGASLVLLPSVRRVIFYSYALGWTYPRGRPGFLYT